MRRTRSWSRRTPPLIIAGLFSAVTALGLVIILSARVVDGRPSRRAAAFGLLAGGLYALSLVPLFASMPLVGAGTATALAMISPLPIALLSLAFLRLRISPAVIGAICIIIVGALMAALGSLSSPLGITLALLSGVSFAASVICARTALRGASIVDVALLTAASSAVLALGVGMDLEGTGAVLVSQDEVRLIALAALGAQLVPVLGRSWALEHLGADIVGAEGVLAPAIAGLLSYWLIAPASSASQWVGLLVIAMGGSLAALAGRRAPQSRGPLS